jgi:hypothetical protein
MGPARAPAENTPRPFSQNKGIRCARRRVRTRSREPPAPGSRNQNPEGALLALARRRDVGQRWCEPEALLDLLDEGALRELLLGEHAGRLWKTPRLVPS